MKVGALVAMPYLPLAALSVPAGAELALTGQSSSTGAWVSSRGPVGGDPVDRPPPLFTRAAIRERSRGWEVKRLEGCGWRLLMAARCVVRSDLPRDELLAVGVHADAFIEALEGVLEGDSSGLRFSVRVFRDRHAFDVYASIAGARGAESFYDARGMEAVLFWPQEGAPWRLLMHELAHAYLDRVFGRREPLWLTEGLAEYFAAYEVVRGKLVPGAADAAEERCIAEARRDGRLIPLRRLLGARRDAFYGDAHALHYAEAWWLMKWLAEHEDEDHPRVLWELVRGKGLHLVWDLRELEEMWLESLPKSSRQ